MHHLFELAMDWESELVALAQGAWARAGGAAAAAAAPESAASVSALGSLDTLGE